MADGHRQVYSYGGYIDIYIWRHRGTLIIYLGGAVSVLATLGWGLYLVKESPGNNKKED